MNILAEGEEFLMFSQFFRKTNVVDSLMLSQPQENEFTTNEQRFCESNKLLERRQLLFLVFA